MTGWILTLGLQNLRNQINEWAPFRDHTSDGTIGDAAHQAEISGHNPDDTAGSKAEWNGDPDNTPEVRAIDCDIDFNNGATAQQVVDHIRNLPGVETVLRYMIYNRKMYHERDNFQPTTYTGESAHTEHIHFSGAFTQAADNNTTFNYRLDEIPMALTDADKTWIANVVNAPFVDTDPTALSETRSGHADLSQQVPDHTQEGSPQTPFYTAFANLANEVMNIKTAVVEIENKVDGL